MFAPSAVSSPWQPEVAELAQQRCVQVGLRTAIRELDELERVDVLEVIRRARKRSTSKRPDSFRS